jgi:hypothetical protein
MDDQQSSSENRPTTPSPLVRWQRFTSRLATRPYGPWPDDYSFELSWRVRLQELLDSEPDEGLAREIADADSVFLEATVEWKPSPLRRYCRITDDWWWLRIPKLGDLATRLRSDEQHYGPD